MIRHDWGRDAVHDLLAQPFHDLLATAHTVHRDSFDPHAVEGAILLSTKTGACPEDCAYYPKSGLLDRLGQRLAEQPVLGR